MQHQALSRRLVLKHGMAASLAFAALPRALARAAEGARATSPPAPRFGGLRRDPGGILELPEGFSYRVLSRTGDAMDDGLRVPGAPDGMGAFPAPGGRTLVIRNHELTHMPASDGPWGADNALFDQVAAKDVYDRGHGKTPALGGATAFLYDPGSRRIERQWLALAGTVRNCAGGPTPWGSWVSCEESVQRPDAHYEREHGFNFEVPAAARGLVAPRPLTAMGRFNHEAIAVDPASGCVFQTEDREDGLLYRFVPEERGNLVAGGRLQAFKVCPCRDGVDLRNRRDFEIGVGETIGAEWIDLDDVEAPGDDLRHRGARAGAAPFARGEGMWCSENGIYFACTSGGMARRGQIFLYTPSPREGTPEEKDDPGTLELVAQPDDAARLDMGDNLTVSPWGELIVCEDGEGEQFLRLLDANGDFHPFARNALNRSELAGACFSPDGSTLFVNIMYPGLTLAIAGPWPRAGA